MAITVDGYGAINESNAKEIYLAYNRGEVELNTAQQTKCESFLSQAEIDEISYDEKVKEKVGSEKIDVTGEDGEPVKDNGYGTEAAGTVASAAASGGTIAAIVTAMQSAQLLSGTNGFVALAVAIGALVCAAASTVLAACFDNQLDDRKAKAEQSTTDNDTMDGYVEGLGASMEMMEEDVKLYQEQSQELTVAKNHQTSEAASLQMELDTAMAMGDTAGAQEIKARMQALSQTDNSKLEEGLAETGSAIQEYRAMGTESAAVAESGQTVSSFLQEGKAKGALAMVNGGLCAAGAIAAGIAAFNAPIPKIWVLIPLGLGFILFPADLISGTAAATMYGAMAGLMGASSTMFFTKGSKELECGSSGDEMQTHVDGLNDMMAQQTQYTDDTEATFEEVDEKSAESQEEAGKQAAGATSNNAQRFGSLTSSSSGSSTGSSTTNSGSSSSGSSSSGTTTA